MYRSRSDRETRPGSHRTVAIIGDPELLDQSKQEILERGFSVECHPSVDAFERSPNRQDPLCWFVSPDLAKDFAHFLERHPNAYTGPVLLISNSDQIGDAVCALQAGVAGRERQLRDRKIEKQIDSLTRRELEVLEGVASGLTNREIAERLCISVRTVESHRANLMDKLEVRSVSALFNKALSYDLIHFQNPGDSEQPASRS